MPCIKTLRQRIESGEKVDVNSIDFKHNSSSMSNIQYATTHGFLFNNETKNNVNHKLTNEMIKLRHDIIAKKLNSDVWKQSPMRDRMYRLKMYTIRQESYINRNGEESVRTIYPAFSSYDMESVLNKQQELFLDTGDPAVLHNWKTSPQNGCSEEELRDTIMDLRVAEQSYPSDKKRQKGKHYITDNEGFTKIVVYRKNGKNRGKKRQQKPLHMLGKNVADLSEM